MSPFLLPSQTCSATNGSSSPRRFLSSPGFRGEYEPISGGHTNNTDQAPYPIPPAHNNGSFNNNNNNGGSRYSNQPTYDIPVGATTENLPPGVLYQVKASYRYSPEDMDELALEAGDIVNVVEYDDPEEQEEGWLMGIKISTGQKGMFPANFTRPI